MLPRSHRRQIVTSWPHARHEYRRALSTGPPAPKSWPFHAVRGILPLGRFRRLSSAPPRGAGVAAPAPRLQDTPPLRHDQLASQIVGVTRCSPFPRGFRPVLTGARRGPRGRVRRVRRDAASMGPGLGARRGVMVVTFSRRYRGELQWGRAWEPGGAGGKGSEPACRPPASMGPGLGARRGRARSTRGCRRGRSFNGAGLGSPEGRDLPADSLVDVVLMLQWGRAWEPGGAVARGHPHRHDQAASMGPGLGARRGWPAPSSPRTR